MEVQVGVELFYLPSKKMEVQVGDELPPRHIYLFIYFRTNSSLVGPCS
jgi:hypothetical protein